MIKVFIDGSSGTTGLRIRQRLSDRPDVALTVLPDNLRKDYEARKSAINQSDITFLCLPDDAAREAVSMAGNDVRIIDASTAHRTAPGWCYGFPELSPEFRTQLAKSKRTAVPGCHASGFAALVYPMVASGLLPADYPLACHSVTGYSGGGKGMISEYEAASRSPLLVSPRQYALSQLHKHLPEMTKICALKSPPLFSPIVADFYSGMVVTVPLHAYLLAPDATPAKVHEMFHEHYRGQKLVKVLPLGTDGEPSGFFAANALSGKDYMEILIHGNSQRILLAARFDNLGKGASGAAIQCMNIMCGLEETLGLEV